jgi:CheY-like chemotaxis protein
VILEESESMLSVLAAEKNIRLERNYGFGADLKLFGDDFWIKQVVVNLLTNAIKFTADGGKVQLGASFDENSKGGGMLRINVKDSGVGIAKEDLDRIFDDFIQVDTPDNESKQIGTGLGLAICKRIVNLYGGTISVESEVGKGSEFKVSIPLAVGAVSKNPDIADDEADAQSLFLRDKRILVADDMRMNLILLSKIMDRHGIRYDLANDGQEGLKLFMAGRYDLLITDIQMPVMDGMELTKFIRQYSDKTKAKLPILGFTGSSTSEGKDRYLSMGMNDVFYKPFDEKDLLNIIERLIRNQDAGI